MIGQCTIPEPAIVTTGTRNAHSQHPDVLRSQRGVRNWRDGLPQLEGPRVQLRELRISDAEAMWFALSRHEPSRFNFPPPVTVEGFEQFITWTHRQRAAGQHICFAMIPRSAGVAVGVIQLRSRVPDFSSAEWGFALGCQYQGSGLFHNGALLAIDFAFGVMGVRRLEAKAVVENVSANTALRRLGAVQEGILHKSFINNGESFDQAVWAIHAEQWSRRAGERARQIKVDMRG
jgi:RimJ/RimL family protein N-acetyltransferase